ncbi:MFS transporter [Streptomyces sp. NPDC091279]|uniref:MFS transporter n=1 Tax=Streptomyces sp. NPDC091279 TaxID=3365983 RepID=UPI003816BADC
MSEPVGPSTGALIPPAPAPVAAGPAHRDPNVLRWVAAYTSSMVGDSVYYLALSWAAVQSGTPAQAGLVMTVSAVPRALLMLGGGVVADRFGPRRVVIVSDAVRCAAVLTVAALLFSTSPGLWPLALLALVFGTVDAVFLPAVGALPARLTTHDQLARVQGMRGLAIRCASVVGAPLGGLAVALGGASAAFALAGALIAVSLPLLLAVRTRVLPTAPGAGGARPGAWRELRDGLGYVRRHRVLAPLLLAIALSDLGFVGPLNVGLTPRWEVRLLFGCGAVVAGCAVPRAPERRCRAVGCLLGGAGCALGGWWSGAGRWGLVAQFPAPLGGVAGLLVCLGGGAGCARLGLVGGCGAVVAGCAVPRVPWWCWWGVGWG